MALVLRTIWIIVICLGIGMFGCQDSTKAYTGEDQDTTVVVNPDTLTTASYNADSLVRLPLPKSK
jgi:hypothetical protein